MWAILAYAAGGPVCACSSRPGSTASALIRRRSCLRLALRCSRACWPALFRRSGAQCGSDQAFKVTGSAESQRARKLLVSPKWRFQ